MTETKTTPRRTTVREKRARHANAQASYMERKRAEGKEWLATWVPGDAKETFRALAKLANEDETKPTDDFISSVETAVGETVPDWAKQSQTLLNLWLVSHNEVSVTLAGAGKKEKAAQPAKDKEPKEKKKKKKKKK